MVLHKISEKPPKKVKFCCFSRWQIDISVFRVWSSGVWAGVWRECLQLDREKLM
jgi:hypothetical protein